MNKNQKFLAFVESMRDSSNSSLIESIKEGFALVENGIHSLPQPNLGGGAMSRFAERNAERNKTEDKPLSADEQQARHEHFARQEKKGAQDQWRVSGGMKQILNYATQNPALVEKWMNEQLKPAILAGKQDTDSKFGTDTAKKSLFQRMKSAAGAFTEAGEELGEDVDVVGDFSVSDEVIADIIAEVMATLDSDYASAEESVYNWFANHPEGTEEECKAELIGE